MLGGLGSQREPKVPGALAHGAGVARAGEARWRWQCPADPACLLCLESTLKTGQSPWIELLLPSRGGVDTCTGDRGPSNPPPLGECLQFTLQSSLYILSLISYLESGLA